MEVMACAKFGIGAIFSFWASLGTPYAAAVQALPWATSALTHGAPSIRTKATRWPPASITAKDMVRPWSAATARAAVQRPVASSRVSMRPVCPNCRRCNGGPRCSRAKPRVDHVGGELLVPDQSGHPRHRRVLTETAQLETHVPGRPREREAVEGLSDAGEQGG